MTAETFIKWWDLFLFGVVCGVAISALVGWATKMSDMHINYRRKELDALLDKAIAEVTKGE